MDSPTPSEKLTFSDDQSNADTDLECFTDRDQKNSYSAEEGDDLSKMSSSRPDTLPPLQDQKSQKVTKHQPQTGGHAPYCQRALAKCPQKPPMCICSKEPPGKDLDMAAKQMLLVRQQKIRDLKNELNIFREQMHNLQCENRRLQELKHKQERKQGPQDYIMQVILRYYNELHMLQEYSRQNQEKKRVAELNQMETEMQLQRTMDKLQKLQQLVNNKKLEERDELTRKLEDVQIRAQASEHRVKKLEKHLELTTKQLASQCRQTQKALKIVEILKEEVQKLKPKIRENNSMGMVPKEENTRGKATECNQEKEDITEK